MRSLTYLREQGSEWDEARIREAAPIVQEKIGRLGEFAGLRRLPVRGRRARIRRCSTRTCSPRRRPQLEAVEPWDAATIEVALKALCERLEAKPKTVYLPIRVAVTGSRISPGLYESLELLGRDVSLARLRRGAELAASDLTAGVPDDVSDQCGRGLVTQARAPRVVGLTFLVCAL